VNLAETHDLLTFVAVFDNRRFDDANVWAWQLVLADLPFTECHTAVGRHFTASTEYLMPAHIRQLVKVIRDEQRQGTAAPLALPSKFEPDVERNLRIKRGVAQCCEVLEPLMRELERRRAAEAGTLTPEEEIRSKAIERARRERREWSP
jgi:hypothetical protein